MPFRKLGFDAWGTTPEALDDCLGQLADAGFAFAEVDTGDGPNGWDLIVGGRLNGRQLARLVSVLDRHRDRLRFTLHGPGLANLFDLANADLHDRILRAGLEVGRAIGSEVMVIHAGQRRPWPAGSTLPMVALLAQERERLRELADEAASFGSALAIETWLPFGDHNRWGYSYAEWPEQLAAQVETVDHPALGVCLDTGHLWAAARWYGFDALAGARRLAPLVNHVHVQDNAGRVPAVGDLADAALGVGRHFLPPGWGEIPLAALLGQVDYPKQPDLLLQLPAERHRSGLADIAADLRQWIA